MSLPLARIHRLSNAVEKVAEVREQLQSTVKSDEFRQRVFEYGYSDSLGAAQLILELHSDLFDYYNASPTRAPYLEQYVMRACPWCLIDRVLQIAQLLGQEHVADACALVRKRPDLLAVNLKVIVRRLMELKTLMPAVQWHTVFHSAPSLLLLPFGAIQRAAKRMSGDAWQGKLGRDSVTLNEFMARVQTEVKRNALLDFIDANPDLDSVFASTLM